MNKRERANNLQHWREETIKEIGDCNTMISSTQKKLIEAEEKLRLIDGLLSLEKSNMPNIPQEKYLKKDLLEEIEDVIRVKGEPMHITSIHQSLIAKGIPLPGKGNEANVIARIQRSGGRIIRTDRGVYGLPELGAIEKKPIKKKRKRVRRK